MPLHVVIVGAGIAGLAAAIGARRAGHTVSVYERSAFANETGAAMWVPPNASGPLLRWDFDPALAKLVVAQGSVYQDPFSMEVLHRVPMGDMVAEKFGARCYFAHRVDLHQELKRLALEVDGVGQAASIHLKSEVASYNPTESSITLANGQVVHADIIIAADGVHSSAARVVLDEVRKPRASELYNYTYRFLIPTSVLKEDPESAAFIESTEGKLVVLLTMPVRDALYAFHVEIYNFSGIHCRPVIKSQSEDWHAGVDKAELERTFEGYHPTVVNMIKKAGEVKCWPLLYRDPTPKMVKGHIALIGDAAHPMLPNQGQGAAMAIEDAVAVGIALCGAERAEVADRLSIFEKIRASRASAMQVLSGAGHEQVGLVAKDAAKYFQSVEDVPKNPKELTEFAFGYDIVEESLRHMRTLTPTFVIPESFFTINKTTTMSGH